MSRAATWDDVNEAKAELRLTERCLKAVVEEFIERISIQFLAKLYDEERKVVFDLIRNIDARRRLEDGR